MFAYLVTGPGGKQYVGITSKTVAQRWSQHVGSAARKRWKSALHEAIRKYGSDAFTVEQIAELTTWEEACRYEVGAIQKYGTFGKGGYNMTLGGDGRRGFSHSEEFKQLMSRVHSGRAVSAETRGKMSAWHSTLPNDVRAERARKTSEANARRTPEDRARISEAIAESKRGKRRDPETVAKVANANRGKTRSAEAIAKTAASNTGRKHSDACRARMSEVAQARREKTAEAMREIWRQRKAAQIGSVQ